MEVIHKLLNNFEFVKVRFVVGEREQDRKTDVDVRQRSTRLKKIHCRKPLKVFHAKETFTPMSRKLDYGFPEASWSYELGIYMLVGTFFSSR